MTDETVEPIAATDEQNSGLYLALGILAGFVMWGASLWVLGALVPDQPQVRGWLFVLPLGFVNMMSAGVGGLISPRRAFAAGLPPVLCISGVAFLILQGIDTTSERTGLLLGLAAVFAGGLVPAVGVLWMIARSGRTTSRRTVVRMRCAGACALLGACACWAWMTSQTASVAGRERLTLEGQVERLLREDVLAEPVIITWDRVAGVGLALSGKSIRLTGKGEIAGEGVQPRVELSIEARRTLPSQAGTAREMDTGDVDVIVREVVGQDDRTPSTPAKVVRDGYLRPEWAGRLRPKPDPMFPDLGKYTATHRGLTFDFVQAGSQVRLHIYGRGRW